MTYKLIKVIGKGSFGKVYKVKNVNDNKEYALKRISTYRMSHKEKINLINEIKIIKYSNCPFILKYVDCNYNYSYIDIITPMYRKGDLKNIIDSRQKINKGLSENIIWKYFIQIVLGLEYLHKNNIIHRDIKTSNIFLDENDKIIIGDFGVSKIFCSNESLTSTNVGTPYYMSPELFKNKPYGKKTDIWSLGCLLVELITLYPPFNGHSIVSLKNNILTMKFYKKLDKYKYSIDLKNLVKKILIINPIKRPSIDDIKNEQSFEKYHNKFFYENIVNNLNITNFYYKFKNIEYNRNWCLVIKELKATYKKQYKLESIQHKYHKPTEKKIPLIKQYNNIDHKYKKHYKLESTQHKYNKLNRSKTKLLPKLKNKHRYQKQENLPKLENKHRYHKQENLPKLENKHRYHKQENLPKLENKHHYRKQENLPKLENKHHYQKQENLPKQLPRLNKIRKKSYFNPIPWGYNKPTKLNIHNHNYYNNYLVNKKKYNHNIYHPNRGYNIITNENYENRINNNNIIHV